MVEALHARYLLIVNPNSAGGATGRRWSKLEGQLREILPASDVALTSSTGHATSIAADAAGTYDVVVAVGGDGTVNEVANGLIDETGAVRHGVAMGVLPLGTGSDFIRSLGIPGKPLAAAAALAGGRPKEVDVGRARFSRDGKDAVRYFVNEAEVGMGAAVCKAVGRSSRRFGGAMAYLWATLATMVRYRDSMVTVAVDDGSGERIHLNNAWIANGAYSGGGIRSAPHARLDDGKLDLVCVSHAGWLRRLAGLPKVRSGTFVDLAHVDYRAIRRVHVVADDAVPVEVDGEPVGTVPATFDLLPTRLTVLA